MTAPATPDHRPAAAALGRELRALVDAALRTGAPADTLHAVAADVGRLAGRLARHRPAPSGGNPPTAEGIQAALLAYSPVTGAGNPLAPPVRVEAAGDGVRGTFTLGAVHEGPPGHAHGGVSALVLDELLGWACAAAGALSMTVDLRLRYHRPVPLRTPLIATARVTGTEERITDVTGEIAAAEEPDAPLVQAHGVFVRPSPEQSRAMFAGAGEPPGRAAV